MTDMRKEVHEEIDRMTERQVVGLNKLLAAGTSPLAVALRNTSESDAPEPREATRLVAEAMEWLRQNRD